MAGQQQEQNGIPAEELFSIIGLKEYEIKKLKEQIVILSQRVAELEQPVEPNDGKDIK